MADKIEKEYDELMKKRLHQKIIDIIELWLKNKLIQLRKASIKEVRKKNDKNLHYFTKNYFIDSGIEKHIKWYSKGRRFDIRNVIQTEMKTIKQRRVDIQEDTR